jgi:hypothetical protein
MKKAKFVIIETCNSAPSRDRIKHAEEVSALLSKGATVLVTGQHDTVHEGSCTTTYYTHLLVPEEADETP